MPANKYALLRYRIIDRCLNNRARPYPNKEDLRLACEDSLYGSSGEHISESTIEKDLWAMRNESDLGFYAPIKYSKEHKGYFYNEDDYSIQDISLNDDDVEAILFAANTLVQFKDAPIFRAFEHAIDKVIDRLTISPNMDDRDVGTHIEFEKGHSSGGAEHLSEILKLIKEKRALKFTYRKFNQEESKAYIVHPYLLKEYRNRWYMIAFEPQRKKYLTFGLERMSQLEPDEKYRVNSDFNVDHFFKHSIGITQLEEEPESVLLKFESSEVPYIKSQPLHESQEILEETKDHALVRLFVLETYELYSTLLSYGSRVEIIEPKGMRDKIKEIMKLALSKY